MGHFEFIEQTRHAFVEDGDAVSASGLCQGAGQPGFADTARASDHEVAFVFDPFGRQQALEQSLVEAPSGCVIHVLGDGTNVAQSGRSHPTFKAFGLATGGFPVD